MPNPGYSTTLSSSQSAKAMNTSLRFGMMPAVLEMTIGIPAGLTQDAWKSSSWSFYILALLPRFFFSSIGNDVPAGSFFGGSPKAVTWWSKVYYSYHDYYLEKGYFVGKDQTLINSLFLLFPSRFISVWLSDPATRTGLLHFDEGVQGSCGSSWYYYQFFMASEEERQMMRMKWMRELKDKVSWLWSGWRWWMDRQECKLSKVVWMRDLLSDAFGKGWGVRKTLLGRS
ncbi:hypothetical protein NP233_g7446 [Leucocoprinus birnbaumii]|uniref:Uncharacterized protein n=1 Tax=Leucocoprinus birnbaumii TaxID=56174 RepID=A0AAD5VR51_9AGAR|nr:hypothetical protein NP233_g7446 [Leucocoprinus birnbaumii]